MDRRKLLTLLPLCMLSAKAFAGTDAAVQMYDQKTLAQVEALYGLSEDAAVSRLASEYEAAVQARRIEGLNLPGYAGAWFDPETQSLHVATNRAEEFGAVEHVGATPALVAHNLIELETVRPNITKALESRVGRGAIRDSYVDVQTNEVVVSIIEHAMSQASAVVAAVHANVPVRLMSVPASEWGFSSSSDLHGADRTRNATWQAGSDGLKSPCSVGASAEKVVGSTYTAGFATAGHCGSVGNKFVANDGITAVGTVMQSTYDYASGTESNNEDGAWVQTVAPWVPQSQINGYRDGILSVSGAWAGMLVAPVGTTVCRYGSTSGGPYCGSVSSLNATYSPTGSITLYRMIKVHGTCTEDGDSGGPLVMPANQVQGTDTGSPNTHSCSVDHSAFDVYFQPIATTLSRAKTSLHSDVAMLTSHGRSVPTVSQYVCPDRANSGSYTYSCNFASYDSQGLTSVSWTTNTGASSDYSEIYGRCSAGQTVNVTLAVSNPYGTTYKNSSFLCPNYPLP